MHLVDEINLVAPAVGCVLDVLEQLAGLDHPWSATLHRPRSGPRNGLHRSPCRQHTRRRARPGYRPRSQFSALARIRREGGLANAACTGKQVRVMHPLRSPARSAAPGRRGPDRPRHCKWRGPPLAGECEITHGYWSNNVSRNCKKEGPRQPHPGARHHRYRCSLPGLTEFAAGRREGTGADPDRRVCSAAARCGQADFVAPEPQIKCMHCIMCAWLPQSLCKINATLQRFRPKSTTTAPSP